MNRLLEPCAVLLLCLPGFLASGSFAVPVLALLLALGIASGAQLFSGRRLSWLLLFCGSAACGLLPVLLCALPLFFYIALRERRWWLILPALTVLFHPGSLSSPQILLTILGLIVTLLLYLRVSELSRSVERLTALQDDITEKNLHLNEKNRLLSVSQDNEIHVATLSERNRIAREIHDNVGHMLTRSILQTGALQVINQDERLKAPLAELGSTLDRAMTSIRESVHNLHDDSIDLRRVLQEMADSADRRFEISLQYDAGDGIPGDIKICVAGIVREGISNAIKHSSGDRIDIVFREHPAFYQLLLSDNGCPAPGSRTSDSPPGETAVSPDDPRSHGIGLRNMRERAESVGGHIRFTSSLQGFRIFMTIPKQNPERSSL